MRDDEGTARLWHLPTGTPSDFILKHADVFAGVFSHHRSRLTISRNQTARIAYSKPPGGRPRSTARARFAPAAFSPDGKKVLVGGEDGNARFWDIDERPATWGPC